MKLLSLNGPNLNMLGIREPDIYGRKTYHELEEYLYTCAAELGIELEQFQSNSEGALVDKIQQAFFHHYDGIVINPAAYTHTSVAILDALKAVALPSVEVHISNLSERESFRQFSYTALACEKTFAGYGFEGYRMAMRYLFEKYRDRAKGIEPLPVLTGGFPPIPRQTP